MTNPSPQSQSKFEQLATRFTNWVGSTSSIILHTIVFAAAFVFIAFGVNVNTVLLILTTAVSLEAIYLAIFIQMTVNRNTQSLEEVEKDIDEIQEDVDEIQEDVEGMEQDIDKLEEEDQKDEVHDATTHLALGKIQGDLQRLMDDIAALKERK